MPTPTKGPRLGGSPAHERLMLANLANALFEHGQITTTKAKARRLRPFAEKLVTLAKRGDLHSRRQAQSVMRNIDVVHRLFDEVAPRYVGRPGGYTRIVKLEPRQGDNAPMAVIQLVEEVKAAAPASSLSRAERLRRSRAAEQKESVAALAGGTDEDAEATATSSESSESTTATSEAEVAAPAPAPANEDTVVEQEAKSDDADK